MKWLDLWQGLSRSGQAERPQPAAARSPLALSLEPRMLFDGAVAATAAEVADSTASSAEPAADNTAQQDTQDTPAIAGGTADTRRELVFVDGNIQDYQQLLAGLPADAEVVMLDASRNGLEQMAEYLEGREGIGAIHVLSHGESGAFKVGNVWIDASDLAGQSETLARIGEALSEDGDILLYGCKTGEGASGAALVTELARLTQADVAASSDNTGAQRLGGDWVLEMQAGAIETASLDAAGMLGFESLLAAPTSENFDGVSLTGGYNLGTPGQARTLNGWTFSVLGSGGTIDPQGFVDYTNVSGDSSMADDGGDVVARLEGAFEVSTGTQAAAVLKASDGSEFSLSSIRIEVGFSAGDDYRLVGYLDGSAVSGATQDFTAGAYGSGGTLVSVSGAAWQFIDEVRIVRQDGAVDISVYVDDIAVSTAVPPNVAPTASNLTQTVAYTEDPGGSVALGDIVVSDADVGDTITATLTLSNPAAGVLTTGTFGSAASTYNAGTGVWTVTGSVTDVNAALAAVAFSPAANWDQDVTIATRIRDAANTGPADGSITLDVTPVNDAPTASNLTQTVAYTEDPGGSVALGDIVVSDVDSGDTITATLTLSNPAAGVLTTGTFGSATSTYNAGTGVWSVSGSLADVNAALAAVAFTPAANWDQDVTIATRIRDAANSGPADGSITLDVTPVNDAPTASNLTQTVSYTEDPGGSVALDDIVVSDADVGDTITATLTLSNPVAGVLTTGTFGSAASTYNAGTGVWTVTGSVTDVNAALAAVAFSPAANWDQDVTIATRIRDAANTGPADGSITLDVTPLNDAPTASNLTQTVAYTEDPGGNVALGDIVVADVDSGETITATLTLSNPAAGVLTTGTFGSATSTYNAGTGVWTVTGSLTDVNAALAAVAFTPAANWDQDVTIATRIRDAADTGPADGSITLDVTPVNDAPTASNLTQTVAYTEDPGGNVALGDIVVTDVDGGDTITATLTLSNPAAGVLTTGTFGSATSTYNAGTGVWTVSGSLTDVNTALAAVAFSPAANWDQDVTIATRVRDAANSGPADGSITLDVTPVNDAPTASNLTQTVAYTEDPGGNVALGDIVVADVDSGETITATLTLSNPAAGVLTTGTFGSATSTYNAGTGVWSVSGSLTDVNAALAAVAFTPAANGDQDVTIATRVRDATSTGPADGTITLDVTPVNDAPTVTTPVSISINEDVSTALTGINFADVDAGSSSVTATFSVASGSLSASSAAGVSVAGSGTASLTLSGSVADINAFIAASQVSFQTALNSTSNVVLTVGIADNGNTGSGGNLDDIDTLMLMVTAVNDAPVNAVPGAQAVDQDAALIFGSGNGNLISISDVDAGGGTLRVTLTASNGLITLPDTTGLSFIVGSGANDGSMTFEGTIADINAALNGLIFSPTPGYNGAASLQITTSDLGLSGSGGTQTDSDTIAITVNSINPEITSVNVSNPDGGYKIGDIISVTVSFDQAVTVNTAGGSPTLLLETGSTDRLATYVSGSGSDTLTFSYTVQAGDLSADLDYQSTGALALNGATIRNATSDDAMLTLPATGGADSIAGQHDLVIDGVAPTVASVSVPANGTYVAGQNLDFTVNFNEAVSVDTSGGTPRIAVTLDTGGTVFADYLSGSGSSALTFRLTVASGQLDSNGIAVAGSIDPNGGTLRDAVGNDAVTTLNGVGNSGGVLIDAVAPVVASVSVPANAAYNAGDVLSFTVNASEAVIVDTAGGTPRLLLDIGGVTRYASYVSGSGSGALLFQYSVQPGDTDSDGIALGGSLELNGASVRDGAGNDLALALSSVGSTAGVIVDTTAPAASGILRIDANPSNAGSVSYTVTFSEGVTGVNAADFALVFAGTASGSIASVTQIDAQTYSVVVGGLAGDGSVRLDLNGSGTGIADIAGNAIGGGLSGSVYDIDRVSPSVTSVAVPAIGTYVAGQNLDFTVHLSEAVIVDTSGGTPRLAVTLDTGGTVFADYLSGSGSSALTFRLTVASGQLDSNGIAVAGNIALNGGTLRDSLGNAALTTLNGIGDTSGVRVDAQVPAVVSLAVPDNGAYSSGDVLTFTVNASEAVLVDSNGGSPRLAIDLGGNTVYADYVSGSGSSALLFQYSVQAGDNDSDGIALAGAIDLNGAILSDAAGNAMSLTLNGAGATGGVIVDTTPPTADSLVRVDLSPTSATSVRFTLTFSEAVSGVDASDFSLLSSGSAVGTLQSVLQLDARTYQIIVGNLAGNGSLGLGLNAAGSAISDAAGNNLIAGLTGESYLIAASGRDPEFLATPPVIGLPPLVTPPPALPSLPALPTTSPLLPPPLFEPPTLGSGIPTLGTIFINNGALAPSFIAQVFASSADSGGDGSGSGFLGFGGGDAGVFGSSTLSNIFGSDSMPESTPLEIFDGKQWRGGGDTGQGQQEVFGAPTLGQQLHDMREAEQRQIHNLAWALGQVQPAEPQA